MTAILETALQPPDADELCDARQQLFDSLSRSDQRRWGEVYVRGLMTVPGRKTIRRISDHIAGGSVDQCLQQFVNQSPWRWEPVRRALAVMARPIRPLAWVVDEAVFPKNGDSSVGVARQYARSIDRTINCQLGLAIFLAGEQDACAVNWRLLLPQSWDDDPIRRARTRVPAGERYRPRWRQVLDAADEMRLHWGLRPAPLVLDAGVWEVQPLIRGLTERGLPYVVRVPGHLPARMSTSEPTRHTLTLGELAVQSALRRQIMLRGFDFTEGGPIAIQYSVTPVCDTCLGRVPARISSACQHPGTRRVLTKWSASSRPSAVWLTNLNNARLADLVELVKLGARTRQRDMAMLRGDFGLQDFEGRSFTGWHHHVTLVSAAHALRTLNRS
jgi:SRSO17 transposase